MEILTQVVCSSKPVVINKCATGTRYSYNIRKEEIKTEGEKSTVWRCDQYWLQGNEYENIQNGILPEGAEWKDHPELHTIFREAQHSRTDPLYAMAYRKRRMSASEKWDDYITALDKWNSDVSALAKKFSTAVPELPETL